jgi:hypothetical protein
VTRHCGWCGVFVSNDTEPTPGANRWGIPLDQLLCPEDAAYWVSLSEANISRLNSETEHAP